MTSAPTMTSAPSSSQHERDFAPESPKPVPSDMEQPSLFHQTWSSRSLFHQTWSGQSLFHQPWSGRSLFLHTWTGQSLFT